MFILSDAGMGKTSLPVMLKLLDLTAFRPGDMKCVVKKLAKGTLNEVEKLEDKIKTLLLLDSLAEDPTAYGPCSCLF